MLKKIVVVLVVLLVVVAFLLMRDYDSPELGQALLDEVGEATGIEMTATGFRFNLLPLLPFQWILSRVRPPQFR